MCTAILAALALALCFVPLFNLLGYEFSLALGLVVPFTSMALGAAHGTSTTTRWRLRWPSLAFSVLSHLSLSLLIISLNAFRVKNCDFAEGLLFFAAIPVASALYAGTLGALIAASVSSPARRKMLYAAALFVPLGARLAELYLQPAIFVFDHLWGHFAGSLYDEAIELDSRMAALRLGTLGRIVLLVQGYRIWNESRTLGRGFVVAATLALAFVSYDEVVGAGYGYRVDRDDIEQELSRVVEREGLTVHLPPEIGHEHALLIADYHRYWYEFLAKRLALTTPPHIDSYVYRDRQQKSRLMGGRGTMVAKPWLGEIHVHGTEIPHWVIPHELVHALAAPLGSGPFAITARGGILIDMGIVEGLAEGLTPSRSDYSLHVWSKALRELGRAPDVRALVSVTDFWRQPPTRAYTVMGSFIDFLLRTRGPEPVRKLYREGDFTAALGEDLDVVSAEWERFVDSQELGERERRAAVERFRQGSIFYRVCAREIAQLRQRASQLPPQAALSIQKTICKHLGGGADAQFDLALAKKRAGLEEEFLEHSEALIYTGQLSAVRTAQLYEERANIAWARGELARARRGFREALTRTVDLGTERLNWVRLWALEFPEPGPTLLREFLSGQSPPVRALFTLDSIEQWFGADPTLRYLRARQYYNAGQIEIARHHLVSAGVHPFQPIEAERVRLLADIAFRSKETTRAADLYEEYASIATLSGESDRMRSFAQFLRWRADSNF